MVIYDGRALSEVTVFGPKLNSFFGSTAKEMHKILHTLFPGSDQLLFPFEHVVVSQVVTHSLEAVFCSKPFVFHFKTKTESLSIKRTTLLEVLKHSRVPGPGEGSCQLIGSHIEHLTNSKEVAITVISVLKELMATSSSSENNPSNIRAHYTRPHLHVSNTTTDNSFYNHLYQDSIGNTSSTPLPSLHLQSINSSLSIMNDRESNREASIRDTSFDSTPFCKHTPLSYIGRIKMKSTYSYLGSHTPFRLQFHREHSSVNACHSSNNTSSSSETVSQCEPNTASCGDKDNVVVTHHKESGDDCSNRDYLEIDDWNHLPSQIQQQLVKELMTGNTPSCNSSDLMTGASSSYNSLKLMTGTPSSFSDSPTEYKPLPVHPETCSEYELEVLQEIEEEWLATQTSSHVSKPLHSNVSILLHKSGYSHQTSFASPFWKAVPSTQEMLLQSRQKALLGNGLEVNRSDTPIVKPLGLSSGSRLTDIIASGKQLGTECSSIDLFSSKINSGSLTAASSSTTSPDLFGEGSVSVNSCKLISTSSQSSIIGSTAGINRPVDIATPQIRRTLDKRKMFSKMAGADVPSAKRIEETLRTGFDQHPTATSTPYMTKRVSGYSAVDNGIPGEDNGAQKVDIGRNRASEMIDSLHDFTHYSGMSPDLL